jgi:hypothetical protein
MQRNLVVLFVLSALAGCSRVESPPVPPSAVAEARTPVSAQPRVPAPSPAASKETALNRPVEVPADHKGLRLYIDPATGETRPPTEAELAAEAAARTRTGTEPAVKAREPVSEIKLSNGMTEVQLGKQAEVAEVVCVLKDGTIGECPDNSTSGLRAKPKP